MKQVDKEHYNFNRYCYFDRWASYYYQLREVLAVQPKNLLEVGVGDAVLKNYLKHNTAVEYKNVDIAEDLSPDIIGSVEKLPIADAAFDAVCAFEVLEHLPFEKFETCITEMGRVSCKYVFLSLPHFGPPISFSIKLPFLLEFKVAFKLPWPREHAFNGQHYWEIGKKGYAASRIRKILENHFVVEKEFVPFENQYHHFFVLRKKD